MCVCVCMCVQNTFNIYRQDLMKSQKRGQWKRKHFNTLEMKRLEKLRRSGQHLATEKTRVRSLMRLATYIHVYKQQIPSVTSR